MINSYENGREQIDALQTLYSELSSPEAMNEAQTRLLFIDTLLFDCLGWNRTDCQVEDRINGQISDYLFSSPCRLLIVEAKKVGTAFSLPIQSKRSRVWKIQTFKRDHPKVFEAIEQAIGYATQRGTAFAAVANGHQLIAFLGSRTDGVEPLLGDALVFASIEEMVNDFRELWNLLGKPGVEQRQLQVLLQASRSPGPPAKMASGIAQYPGLKRRNKLQVELSSVADYLLEDLLLTHGEIEFLTMCYCQSGPLAEYAAVSKNILKTRYSAMFEKTTGGPQLEPVVTKKGTARELMSVPPGRPLLLLGDIGVGKSVFLNHFINIDAAELKASTIFLYVNLLRMPSVRVDALWTHVVREVREQLAMEHEIDIDADDFVRLVYHNELERFAKTPDGRLKGIDDATYEIQRAKFIRQYTSDDTRHIRSSMQAVQKGTQRQITLVLDNIDHHLPDFQEEVFRIAEHAADAWGITVFVAMRPGTFYQSKQRGVIAAYQPRAFTVSPPRVSEVIDRRLAYISKLVATGTDHVLQNIRQHVPSLEDYHNIIVRSFKQNAELIECIENLSGGNIRSALEYLKDFLGSGHVDTDDILSDKLTYQIARHQFLRTIIFRDGEYFSPHHSEIANVFDISTADGKEHFLVLIIVAQLDQWARMRPGEGFVEAGELFDALQSLGFSPEQVDFALQRALSRHLIQGVENIDGQSVSNRAKLRVTTVGGYYHRTLCRMFTYVDAITVDLPVVDERFRDRIKDIDDINQRLIRGLIVVEYLDDQWQLLATRDCVLDWPEISEQLCADIKRIQDRPKRERKHHF